MKEWLTAREIAAERLPDLPSTESGMVRHANSLGWDQSLAYARKRAGRGGGIEYHVALLPDTARLEYNRRHLKIVAIVPPAANDEALAGSTLSDRATKERDARLAILSAFDRFCKGLGLGPASCVQIFVDRYNAGTHAVEPWIRDAVPRLSKRTLARWKAAKAAGRANALAVDKAAARKGTGVLDVANNGAARDLLIALIGDNPLFSADHLRDQLSDAFKQGLTLPDGRIVPVPSKRTIQWFVARLKETKKVVLTKISAPDTFRSRYTIVGTGSHRWIDEPNRLWMIDASPLDALDETAARPTIYACIDIGTRRTIWLVTRTPRAAAVGLLVRKAILSWGVPDKIKTDNGSDFVAEATKRLFAALDIEMELSDPYAPQQKGHVERAIKTMQHDFAALLTGFVGHNVGDRKKLEERKALSWRLGQDEATIFGATLPIAEIQRLVDDWNEFHYEERPHDALKGISPAEAARRSSAPIRRVDERALDLMLMPIAGGDGVRKYSKQGLKIARDHYILPGALVGDRLLCRMDPQDAGRVYAFDADSGVFRGIAECPALSGADPAALLAKAKEMEAAILGPAVREAKRIAKEHVRDRSYIARSLDVGRREKAAAEAARGNVVSLPKREERHETPAIQAAIEAMTPPTHAPRPLPPRAAELYAEMQVGPAMPTATEKVRPLRTQETRQQRFRRALDLEARKAAGLPLTEEESFWLGGYSAGPEYRGMRTLHDDGGETVKC